MLVVLPDWLKQLYDTEVVRRVKNDPRTIPGTALGVSPDDVQHQTIGWGQAEFDEPWGNLSPDDRALLYAYFLQRGHLEELTEAFRMLFSDSHPKGELIVVDLGCGPCTGGLAIAGALGSDSRFDYIGVDRSRAMRSLGEQLAKATHGFDEASQIDHHWYADVSEVDWTSTLGWRPVFIIASYLLASPTLDATKLVADLDNLLKELGRGSVTVLYTNSITLDANYNFPEFKNALLGVGFRIVTDDEGVINIQRWAGQRSRRLRYALFHRPEQSMLPLGVD